MSHIDISCINGDLGIRPVRPGSCSKLLQYPLMLPSHRHAPARRAFPRSAAGSVRGRAGVGNSRPVPTDVEENRNFRLPPEPYRNHGPQASEIQSPLPAQSLTSVFLAGHVECDVSPASHRLPPSALQSLSTLAIVTCAPRWIDRDWLECLSLLKSTPGRKR